MRKVPATVAAAVLLLTCRPQAQGLETLTVTLLPGSVSFSLTANSANNSGNTALTALTSWNLNPARLNVSLYAYFTSATAALAHSAAGNTIDIPSARVEVSVNGGARNPFNQTVPFGAANAGRQIFSQLITGLNSNSSRSDTLALNINLSGYVLPADTYTGALRVRAQATP